MPVYAYQALDSEGTPVAGELAVDDVALLRGFLADRGLLLVEARSRSEHAKGERRGRISAPRSGLIELTRNLGDLLAAGLPLVQVLEDLEDQPERRAWQRLLHDVRLRIEGGASLSEALAAHPAVFSGVYVHLVRAGEESGQLPEVFARLTAFLEWRQQLKEEVRRALGYPAFVLAAMAGLVALMTLFVIPRLELVFVELDIELPLPTRMLVATGHLAGALWPYVLGVGGAACGAIALLRRGAAGRAWLDRLLLALPLAGRLAGLVAYARVTSTLATLLGAGVRLTRALELTADSAGNLAIGHWLAAVNERIQSGETFAEALHHGNRFPRLLVRMARVGEATGDLAAMLAKCSEFYQRESPAVMRRIFGAIGPLTVIALAGFVALAALAVFLPLLSVGAGLR